MTHEDPAEGLGGARVEIARIGDGRKAPSSATPVRSREAPGIEPVGPFGHDQDERRAKDADT